MPKKVRRNNRSVRKTRKNRRTRRTKKVRKQYGGVDSEEANSPPETDPQGLGKLPLAEIPPNMDFDDLGPRPSDKLTPSLVTNPGALPTGTGENLLNISDLLKIPPGQPTLSLAPTPFTAPLPPAEVSITKCLTFTTILSLVDIVYVFALFTVILLNP